MALNIRLDGRVAILSNFARLMNDPQLRRCRPRRPGTARSGSSQFRDRARRSQGNRVQLSRRPDDDHARDPSRQGRGCAGPHQPRRGKVPRHDATGRLLGCFWHDRRGRPVFSACQSAPRGLTESRERVEILQQQIQGDNARMRACPLRRVEHGHQRCRSVNRESLAIVAADVLIGGRTVLGFESDGIPFDFRAGLESDGAHEHGLGQAPGVTEV